MPRFVLLHHECPPGYDRTSHWDLMLEAGKSLRTWALIKLPQDWQAAQSHTASLVPSCAAPSNENIVGAELLGDHRRDYLDYEGPVSGERGRVRRIDEGTYKTLSDSAERWTIELRGGHLQGTVTLTADTENSDNWTLTLDTSD
jgi:hypothetical protein